MKIFFISYYFPPCGAGWSIRTVNFIKHFSQLGWHCTVLTVKEAYYKENQPAAATKTALFPDSVVVVRTKSLEPQKPLAPPELSSLAQASAAQATIKTLKTEQVSLKNRLSVKLARFIERFFLIPDVKILWLPYALLAGRKVIKEQTPDFIFASLPVFSAGIIGWLLKKITGVQLIVDFRDDWAENPAYQHPYHWGRFLNCWYEKKVVAAADIVVVVTQQSLDSFKQRYPDHQHYLFIPNGYDPRLEAAVAAHPQARTAKKPFTLVHAGLLAVERDPSTFFQVLAEKYQKNPRLSETLRLVFTGSSQARYPEMVKTLGLDAMVTFTGSLPYEENIHWLQAADALLLLPSHQAPASIPGKVYEYLYLRKPILALSLENASTALLESWGLGLLADPFDKEAIRRQLYRLLEQLEKQDFPLPDNALVKTYSRKEQAGQLADALLTFKETFQA